jgi:flagellar hook-associated protein 2
MYPILPIHGTERFLKRADLPHNLPVRPARGIKRYEEHLDYHRYTQAKRAKQYEEEENGKKPLSERSFPYAKEAEIESAAEFARAVAAVLTAAARLKLILEDFRETGRGSILQKRTVRSSAPGTVTASAFHHAVPQTLRITVRRLAAAQLNRTAFYTPNAPTTVEPGFNRIRMETGGNSRFIDLLVLSGDTHKTVLTRLRNVWNESITGIRAALESDPDTGRLRLALEGTVPGSAHAFLLEDSAGNTAATTGLLVKDRAASDAEIRVGHGAWTTHPGNRILLAQDKLQLHLHSSAMEPAILTIEPDTVSMALKLQELSDHIRMLKSQLEAAADYINPVFTRSLDHADAGDRMLEMAHMLNEQYPQVVEQLTASDGILARLQHLLAHMEGSPAEELLNRGHTRYKRYANYLSSLDWYSQLPSQGLLLNRFF